MRIKYFFSRIILVCIFFLSLTLAIVSPHFQEGSARAVDSDSVPTLVYTNPEGQQVVAPDFNNLSFGNLPPIEESGWIQIPREFVAQLGYDPSRVWEKFTPIADVVKLGDIEDALGVGNFSLQAISDITHLDTKRIKLSALEIAQQQTIGDLVKAIPGLGKLNVSQAKPIADLIGQVGGSTGRNKIATIAQNQTLAKLPLGKHLNLSKYSLDSIPGLLATPLQNFRAWQQSSVAGVLGKSGLSSVPFSAFPNPLLNGLIQVAKVDVVWGKAEHGDSKVPSDLFISGAVKDKSDKLVPVSCSTDKSCPYMELTDAINPNKATDKSLHGKRWVVGGSNGIWVKEGYGPLANLNNGWGAAGVTVFGANFGKIALLETEESTGRARFGLFKRVCVTIPFFGKSCSPYFIGPIPLPFLDTKEKGLVIVGVAAK
jgi:hypothetical protein